MKAINLLDTNEKSVNDMLNEQLVLSVAKATEMTIKFGDKVETITMLVAQNRMRKARENASYFGETSKQYAMHTTVAKFYNEKLKQFRAVTINNEEWRDLALSNIEGKEQMLKVVLEYDFEDDIDKDTEEYILNQMQ